MAKIVIDPQKSVWPFVYKVMAKDPLTNPYEVERYKAVNKWIIDTTRNDGTIIVVERMMCDGVERTHYTFAMEALHVKGGVVLRTTSDILEFLNS